MKLGGGEGGRGISFSRIGGSPDRKVGSIVVLASLPGMKGFWARSSPVCPNPMKRFDDVTRKISNSNLKFPSMTEYF
jgi:hypothetical protein